MKSPTENQWQLAETLVCVLKQFEVATKDMSSDNACASQIIPFILSMEKFLDYAVQTATGIKTIVDELRSDFLKRFQKYKDNDQLKVAMMLDPRFKLKYIEQASEGMIKEILFQEYFRSRSKSLQLTKLELDAAEEDLTETQSDPDLSPPLSDSDGSPNKKRKLMSMDIYSFFQKKSQPETSVSSTSSKHGSKMKRFKKSKTQKTKEHWYD